MKIPLHLLLAAISALVPATVASAAPGTEAGHHSAGFYGISRHGDGRWWVVVPDGSTTFLRGVDHANWNGHWCEALGTNPYRDEMQKRFNGDRAAWEEETIARLKAWGFNALGAGCSKELRGRGLAHCEFLAMGEKFCRKGAEFEIGHFQGIPGTALPNVFHPEWPAFCDARAEQLCAPQKDDASLFGYFFDNELDWRCRGSTATGVFDAVARLPETHPARRALDDFLVSAGKTAATAEEADKTEFLRLVARRYFETVAKAIRRHDPNHLLLGCRFAGGGGNQAVWEEAGRFCDAVTFNIYPWADLDRGVVYTGRTSGRTVADYFAERHAWTGRPLMITEWSFPALDAGLPCSGGAGQRFRTQAERVEATELFARTMLSLPFMIGYDYFMWVDEPALGISAKFPENSNYGLVNERGEPYGALTAMFARLHPQSAAIHAEGAMPCDIAGSGGAHGIGEPLHAAAVPVAGPPACGAPAEFTRDGAGYTLRTASGLVLSGRVGGADFFDSVVADGLDCGRFTAMAFHRTWQDIGRVTDVQWDAGRNSLRVTGEGRDDGMAFRIVCDIRAVPDRPWFVCDLVRLENIGSETFPDAFALLRQYAPWATDAARPDAPRTAPNVWKEPSGAAWFRVADGAWCGAATSAPTVRHFVYWISPDGKPHPDAGFTPPDGPLRLAPGDSWEPRGAAWMVCGAGTGAMAGWRAFLDTVPQ